MSQQPKTMKTVYTVVEREGKSHWVKLGIGFTNTDGSLNLKLDALPINHSLQVRDYESPEERDARFGRLGRPSADTTGAYPGLA